MAFELPKLNYEYNGLEPYIDAMTMEIHHSKHHNAYVTKLNAALEGTEFASESSIDTLISSVNKLPENIKAAVRNNGGGHANHTLFWETLAPGGNTEPTGALLTAINDAFGSFNQFKDLFNTAAATRFGSGWAWLGVNSEGTLVVSSTPNQDNPLMEDIVDVSLKPILGCDVWEHAYYLKYQNKRPDYIDAFWNVVNWDVVAQKYDQSIS